VALSRCVPKLFFGAVLTFIAADLMRDWLWQSRARVHPAEYAIIWCTSLRVRVRVRVRVGVTLTLPSLTLTLTLPLTPTRCTFLLINAFDLEIGMACGVLVAMLHFILDYARVPVVQRVALRANVMRSPELSSVLDELQPAVMTLR